MPQNRSFGWAAFLAAALFFSVSSFAAPPQKVLYQGTLRRSGAVYTGNATFVFRLTDSSGGTEYWTSGSTVVAVSMGLFRYPIGVDNAGGTGLSGKPLSGVDWPNITPYIEVTIDGTVLTPREAMASVPYALSNEDTTKLPKTGGAMTGPLTLSGSTLTVSGGAFSVGGSTFTVLSGRVGIGTTNPSYSLDVQGDVRSTGVFVGSGAKLSGLNFDGAPAVTGMTLYNDGGTLKWNGSALAVGSSVSGTTGFVPKFTDATSLGNSVLFESGGNVGVGTTVPGAKLDVSGSARFGSGSSKSTFTSTGDLILASGSSVTLSGANGFITSGSSITASAFFGYGGNLTGISAGESNTYTSSKTFAASVLSGGSVTASAFFGYGGNLTGLPSSETNTYASSKTFTGSVLSGASVTASAFFGYGGNLTGLPPSESNTYTSSKTFTAGAFSVGGSSFTVSGGSATVAYQFSAGSFAGNGAALTGIPSTASIAGIYAPLAGATFTGASGITNQAFTATGVNGHIVSAASITASAFFGYGGNLTGLPPSEINTYTSSKTFTSGVGITGGDFLVISTATIRGNAFSVGGSSFTVSGGSATVAYQFSAGSFAGNGAALTGIPSTASIAGVYAPLSGATFTGASGITNQAFTATGVNGNIVSAASITASAFFGYGGNLTGLPPSEINTYTSSKTFTANAFSVGGSTFVVAGGKVAVGTTAPKNIFSVNQPAFTASDPYSYGMSLMSSADTDLAFGSDAGFSYLQSWQSKPLQINSQGNNTIINPSGNNVGVGTTNPVTKLEVNGSAQFGSGSSKSTFTASGALFMNSGSSITLSGSNGFITGGSSINASAFFGSGAALTGIPSSASISGTYLAKNGDGMTGPLTMLSNSTITIGGSAFSVGGSTLVVVGGKVGIGTTNPGQQLELTGNMRLAAASVIYSGVTPYIHNTGTLNFFAGVNAGTSTTTGDSNVGVGAGALASVTTTSGNTALGYTALNSNLAGSNTALGYQTLFSNNTGNQNTASGYQALKANVDGYENAAYGSYALTANTSGRQNVALGVSSLQLNLGGEFNAAVGHYALRQNLSGTHNVALGYYAGVTANAANANTSGTYNVFLGDSAGPGTATQLTNAIAIGKNALVSANNAMALGGTGADAVSVAIGTATPASKLHVVDGDIRVSTSPGGSSRGIYFQDGSLQTSAAGAGAGSWGTSGTDIYSTNAGSVGIGTANPATKLDVNGSAQFGAGAAKSTFSATGALTLAGNAALTLSGASGHITTASSVTASAFFGNGSALTNLSAASLGGSPTFSTLTLTGNAFSVGASTLVVVSGNIGISSATPTERLVIGPESASAGTRSVLRFNGGWSEPALGDVAGDRMIFYRNANVKTAIGFGAANDMWFQTHGPSAGPAFRWFYQTSGGEPLEKMRLDVTGKLGIGSAAPADRLHIRSQSGLPYGLIIEADSSFDPGIMFRSGQSTVTYMTAGSGGLFSMESSSFAFHTTAFGGVSNALRIQTNGSIGVGTTAPATKLHLSSGTLKIDGNTATSISASGKIVISTINYGGDASLHIIGALAFGRTTQISANVPSGSALNLMSSRDASNVDQWWAWGVNNNIWTIRPGTSFAGTAGLSINSSGQVGIGTTSPNAALHILNGDIRISTTAGSNGIYFQDGSLQTTAAAGGNLWADRGSSRISNTNTGNVGVGTSAPDALFQVGGATLAATASGNVGIGMTNPQAYLDLAMDNGSGSAANQYGIHISRSAGAGVTATNVYGIKINTLDYLGATTNVYGLYVGSTYASTAKYGIYVSDQGPMDNAYALYIAGTDVANKAYFGGKVGIGTTGPTAKLHMSSGTLIVDGTAAEIILGKGDAVSTSRTTLRYQNGGYNQPLPSANNTLANGDKLVLWNDGSGKVAIGVGESYNLQLQGTGGTIDFLTGSAGAAPTTRMRVNNAGAVGVGSVGAAYTGSVPLYVSRGSVADVDDVLVQGNTRSYITIESTATSANTYASLKLQNSGNAGRSWQIAATSQEQGQFYIGKGNNVPAASSQFAILPTGEVGINKPIPSATLEVQSLAAPAAMALRISSQNAAGMLVVRGDGNVGIGTASPQAPLSLGVGVGPRLLLYDNGATYHAGFFGDAPGGNDIAFLAHNAGALVFGRTALGATPTFANEWMRITNAGNVGIGTPSPSATLHISSAPTSGNTVLFQVGGGTITALGSGNVGIGTTSPASKFTVLDGDIRISTTSGSKGIYFQDGSLQITAAAGGNLWADRGSNNISNTNSANVGIGTSVPATKLHLSSGTILIDGNAATSLWTNGLVGVGNGNAAGYTNGSGTHLFEVGAGTLNVYGGGYVGINMNGRVSGVSSQYPLAVSYPPAASAQYAYANAGYSSGTMLALVHPDVSRGMACIGFGAHGGSLAPPSAAICDDMINNGTPQSADLAFLTNPNKYNGSSYSNPALERMRITSLGDIGIGTTLPYARVHISTAIADTAALNNTTPSVLKISNANNVTGNYSLIKFSFPNNDTNALIGSQLTNSSNGEAALVFATRNTAPQTNEWMRITGSGNVGIGTINPIAKLDIQDTSATDTYSLLVGTGPSAYNLVVATTGVTSIFTEKPAYYTPPPAVSVLHLFKSSLSTIGTANQLLIGSANGVGALAQIGFGWTNTLAVNYAPGVFGFAATDAGGYTKGDFFVATRDVTTDSQPTQRMRITSAGNVGIGTTAPSAALHLSSAATAAATPIFIVSSGTAAGQELLRVQKDGKVGIGIASPGYELDVVGVVHATGRFLTNEVGNGLDMRSEVGANARTNIFMRGTDGSSVNKDWYIGLNHNVLGGVFEIYGPSGSNFLINNSGNVGAGTTNPAAKLHVLDGDIKISTTSGSRGIIFQDGTTQVTAASSGGVLQYVSSGTTGRTGAQGSAIPTDDTIPQIGEGFQVLSATITPIGSNNRLIIEANVNYDEAVNNCNRGALCLFKDATADAIACVSVFTSGSPVFGTATLVYKESTASTTQRVYSVRLGCEAATTMSVNTQAGGNIYGNSLLSTLTITEISGP